MNRVPLVLASLACVLGTTACSLGTTARMGTGIVSHTVCTAVFVSGIDGDAAYQAALVPMPAIGAFDWGLRYRVDRPHRRVTTTLLGGYEETASYEDGAGCQSHPGGHPAPLPIDADGAGPDVVAPTSAALQSAIDGAFAPTASGDGQRTKAVVVMHHGVIVGERYATGYGVSTPVPGYSDTKSVMSALAGVLVREGKLDPMAPAPIATWATDRRHAITIDHLLRMRSGLAWDESLSGGADDAARMWFLEPDMASLPLSRGVAWTPGSRWQYASGNSVVVARIVRDLAGGTGDDVLRFAERELFAPLGMHHVVLALDATGTPNGASGMLASPRDWARFGELYLADGKVGEQRILPEGWVTYAASPQSDAWVGYGAGFWTNRGESEGARRRRNWGMPEGSFFASGIFGQVILVDPADDLVIARFGWSHGNFGGLEEISHHVGAIVAAVRGAQENRASKGAM